MSVEKMLYQQNARAGLIGKRQSEDPVGVVALSDPDTQAQLLVFTPSELEILLHTQGLSPFNYTIEMADKLGVRFQSMVSQAYTFSRRNVGSVPEGRKSHRDLYSTAIHLGLGAPQALIGFNSLIARVFEECYVLRRSQGDPVRVVALMQAHNKRYAMAKCRGVTFTPLQLKVIARRGSTDSAISDELGSSKSVISGARNRFYSNNEDIVPLGTKDTLLYLDTLMEELGLLEPEAIAALEAHIERIYQEAVPLYNR